MENNSNKDISVFTFTRGSQTQPNLVNSESYGFVLGVINSMMTRSGVDTPKVGFGVVGAATAAAGFKFLRIREI